MFNSLVITFTINHVCLFCVFDDGLIKPQLNKFSPTSTTLNLFSSTSTPWQKDAVEASRFTMIKQRVTKDELTRTHAQTHAHICASDTAPLKMSWPNVPLLVKSGEV